MKGVAKAAPFFLARCLTALVSTGGSAPKPPRPSRPTRRGGFYFCRDDTVAGFRMSSRHEKAAFARITVRDDNVSLATLLSRQKYWTGSSPAGNEVVYFESLLEVAIFTRPYVAEHDNERRMPDM